MLAEGRRAAIIEALGFKNGVIDGLGGEKVFLTKGSQGVGALYQDLKSDPDLEKFISSYGFKYTNYENMQEILKDLVGAGTPADNNSPAVEQAFSRSAAIVIPKESMKYCTH